MCNTFLELSFFVQIDFQPILILLKLYFVTTNGLSILRKKLTICSPTIHNELFVNPFLDNIPSI